MPEEQTPAKEPPEHSLLRANSELARLKVELARAKLTSNELARDVIRIFQTAYTLSADSAAYSKTQKPRSLTGREVNKVVLAACYDTLNAQGLTPFTEKVGCEFAVARCEAVATVPACRGMEPGRVAAVHAAGYRWSVTGEVVLKCRVTVSVAVNPTH